MLLIYTGNGKGKTCASVGQAIRAHGQGLRVAFGQFMKRPQQAGEQIVCAALLGSAFYAGGCGFFRKEEERPAHREAALSVLAFAQAQLALVDMLVLDESLYALGSGLITEEELRAIAAEARERRVFLVLSGRGAPPWLVDEADIVTEMGEIKHAFRDGRGPTKGIEF